MPFPLTTSFYAFGVVFVLLGGACVLIRFLVRERGKGVFDNLSDTPRGEACLEDHDQSGLRSSGESLSPPPLPANEFEFYQAGQDAIYKNVISGKLQTAAKWDIDRLVLTREFAFLVGIRQRAYVK